MSEGTSDGWTAVGATDANGRPYCQQRGRWWLARAVVDGESTYTLFEVNGDRKQQRITMDDVDMLKALAKEWDAARDNSTGHSER